VVTAEPENELLTLARRLYSRRATGVIVPYKMLDSRHVEWDCHQNAGIWTRDNPGWKVVHGWLVFDFTLIPVLPLRFVRFNPHSVVEDKDGSRVDVTPSRASQRYLFLDHEGPPDDFIRVVQGNAMIHIDYDVSEDRFSVATIG
jgi:hypothetical protein